MEKIDQEIASIEKRIERLRNQKPLVEWLAGTGNESELRLLQARLRDLREERDRLLKGETGENRGSRGNTGGEDPTARTRARRIAELEAEAEAMRRLADAYAQGEKAAARMRVVLEAERIARREGIDLASEEGRRILEAIQAREQARRRIEAISEARGIEAELLHEIQRRETELLRLQLEASGLSRQEIEARLRLRELEIELQERGIDLSDEEIRRLVERLRLLEEQRARADELREAQQQAAESGREVASVLVDGFRSATLEARDFEQTLADVARRLADLAFQRLVAEPFVDWLGRALGSAFGAGSSGVAGGTAGGGAAATAAGTITIASAYGNVFDRGHVLPFARGGVVDRPVVFPLGLAGERGPEAILPLRRLPDGRLGVSAAGGGGAVAVNIRVVDARGGDAETIRASVRRHGPDTLDIDLVVLDALRRLVDSGRADTVFGPAMGVRRRLV